MEKAIFSAGCFWSIEEAFRQLKGVIRTTAGYCGGHLAYPTYKQVCTGTTGHAESVLVEYDPHLISYESLLHTFWKIHDPTTYHRQGWDVGEQYRSIIFYFNPEQEQQARKSLEEEQKHHREKIVTEIRGAVPFYPAEEYHQCYLEKKKKK